MLHKLEYQDDYICVSWVISELLLMVSTHPNEQLVWLISSYSGCNGHNEVVELLLKANVNPNACFSNGAIAIYRDCGLFTHLTLFWC